MNPRLKKFTAIAAIACAGLGLANQGWACMSVSPPPVLRLATPADLPERLTLNPGQRIEFAIPHPENMQIEIVGDLQLLSKPGDAHLALGVLPDATHVEGKIQFPGSDAIYRRCTPAATNVRLVRPQITGPSIREVEVDLTQAEQVAELSRRPVRIDGHDLLKVMVSSDKPNVVLTANGRIWVPARLAFDVEKRIFTAWFRDSGLGGNPTNQPYDITVKRLLKGIWQLEHFKVESMPTPTSRC